MADPSTSKETNEEIKHDAVPGYLKGFAIAIAVMGLYLATILISSPGKVKHGYGDSHADKYSKPATEETPHDAEESKSH